MLRTPTAAVLHAAGPSALLHPARAAAAAAVAPAML